MLQSATVMLRRGEVDRFALKSERFTLERRKVQARMRVGEMGKS